MSGYQYRGKLKGDLDPWAQEPAPVRDVCGTSTGYQRHRSKHEAACDECLVAWRDYGRQWRKARSKPKPPKPECGTYAGRHRHRREGTEACDPCMKATAAYMRELHRKRREAA